MPPADPNVNNLCYQQALEDSNSMGCQAIEPVNIVNVEKVIGREECENPIQKSLAQKEKAQEQMGDILSASKVIKAVERAKLSERNLPDFGHRDEEPNWRERLSCTIVTAFGYVLLVSGSCEI
ncbi:hypothetical protein V6N13_091814 [Hibiscus sabdariffa]